MDKLLARYAASPATSEEAIEQVRVHEPHAVTYDLWMPGESPLGGFKSFREASPHSKVIIISMDRDRERIKEALCYRANDFLLKPVTEDNLGTLLESLKAAARESRSPN